MEKRVVMRLSNNYYSVALILIQLFFVLLRDKGLSRYKIDFFVYLGCVAMYF